MLIIGLMIAAAAAVFAAVVTIEDWGGPSYTIHGFGHVLGSLTLAEVFVAGLGISAIFFLALWLASFSSSLQRRRSARRRAEARALRENYEAVLAERDQLARELGRESHYAQGDDAVGDGRPAADSEREYPAYPTDPYADGATEPHTVGQPVHGRHSV